MGCPCRLEPQRKVEHRLGAWQTNPEARVAARDQLGEDLRHNYHDRDTIEPGESLKYEIQCHNQ
eukprot:CAMPEP_0119499150 /NCGR_PEP_ID=MMETSP1344-20130328/21701_1 /TAXON_ID=236787 /ORGANISM="Florenciella parvula, Strain CCMP2471" /LENGTH=63 /DNA_ID=CAMNT_0007535115 /DNA_START=12 /DNA_END=203 /DNA_ORIENTATION=+